MDFGDALKSLKDGKKLAREGWNGKNQYIRYVDLYNDKAYRVTECNPIDGTFYPFLAIKTNYNRFIPWLASQTDMLAEDWYIVD